MWRKGLSVLHAKQATSLRVDQGLYERLATLAKSKGTSITHQVEDAIRAHLEAAVVADHKPVLESTVARVVNESLEATINEKIEELKQRLSGLLAKNAVDTAVLYLMSVRRMGEEEVSAWRKAAASHVRGRLVDLQAEALAAEEMGALRRKAEDLARREKAATDALVQHQAEAERLKREMEGLRELIGWNTGLVRWLEAEWDKQSLLGRRKPFDTCVREFEQQTPRPKGA